MVSRAFIGRMTDYIEADVIFSDKHLITRFDH